MHPSQGISSIATSAVTSVKQKLFLFCFYFQLRSIHQWRVRTRPESRILSQKEMIPLVGQGSGSNQSHEQQSYSSSDQCPTEI